MQVVGDCAKIINWHSVRELSCKSEKILIFWIDQPVDETVHAHHQPKTNFYINFFVLVLHKSFWFKTWHIFLANENPIFFINNQKIDTTTNQDNSPPNISTVELPSKESSKVRFEECEKNNVDPIQWRNVC